MPLGSFTKRWITPGRLLAAWGALLLLLSTPLEARKVKKRRPAPPPPPAFSPSPEIEERVVTEVAKAQAVLTAEEPERLLANPYLVSAVYFHDGFLERFPRDSPTAEPSARVSAHLQQAVTPEHRSRIVTLLRRLYPSPAVPLIRPVPYREAPAWARRRAHQDALDLFVPEGTPVRSASAGVVVLAEQGWTDTEPFSTSSYKGGNTVIVFEAHSGRFFRYGHLAEVQVRPGMMVTPGHPLGTVGHSGMNAARPGHGGHLHFEINQFDGRTVYSWHREQIVDLLRTLPAGPAYTPPSLFRPRLVPLEEPPVLGTLAPIGD